MTSTLVIDTIVHPPHALWAKVMDRLWYGIDTLFIDPLWDSTLEDFLGKTGAVTFFGTHWRILLLALFTFLQEGRKPFVKALLSRKFHTGFHDHKILPFFVTICRRIRFVFFSEDFLSLQVKMFSKYSPSHLFQS